MRLLGLVMFHERSKLSVDLGRPHEGRLAARNSASKSGFSRGSSIAGWRGVSERAVELGLWLLQFQLKKFFF